MSESEADDALPQRLRTPVWRMLGFTRSVPGTLELSRQRLRYYEQGRCMFDRPLDEIVKVRMPWYWFGGGIRFRAGTMRYRFSFVEPQRADHVAEGRRNGALWKRVLMR